MQAQPERLQRQLLGDVEAQPAARVEHPLHAPRRARPGPTPAASSASASRRSLFSTTLLGTGRDRGEVAEPGSSRGQAQIQGPVRARRSIRFTCSPASRVSLPASGRA